MSLLRCKCNSNSICITFAYEKIRAPQRQWHDSRGVERTDRSTPVREVLPAWIERHLKILEVREHQSWTNTMKLVKKALLCFLPPLDSPTSITEMPEAL